MVRDNVRWSSTEYVGLVLCTILPVEDTAYTCTVPSHTIRPQCTHGSA